MAFSIRVREHLEDAVGVGGRGRTASAFDEERDARALCLALVPGAGFVCEVCQVDRAGGDGEGTLVEAGEIEQVADEVLEPVRFLDDDAGGLGYVEHVVEQGLAVGADRGERRFQFVADREQERAFRFFGASEFLLHPVERVRDTPRPRRAITQTSKTLSPVATNPFPGATDAHTRSVRRRNHRPTDRQRAPR